MTTVLKSLRVRLVLDCLSCFSGYSGGSCKGVIRSNNTRKIASHDTIKRLLRARRPLLIFKYDPVRTRRALSLYKVYDDSALLVLEGKSLNSDNVLSGSQPNIFE